MKYYSEILKEQFNTEKECLEAEAKHKQELEEQKAKENEAKLIVSKEKKELSKAVEEAEKAVADAFAQYELVEVQVADLIAECNKKVEELRKPAKQAIQKAEQQKYEAIAAYNKKYGTYSVVYTGDKAFNEFKRLSSIVDKLFF